MARRVTYMERSRTMGLRKSILIGRTRDLARISLLGSGLSILLLSLSFPVSFLNLFAFAARIVGAYVSFRNTSERIETNPLCTSH